jgi:hypothetical protein
VQTEKREPAHRIMYARLCGRVKAQPGEGDVKPLVSALTPG